MKKFAIAAIMLLGLTACKEVDKEQVNATKVQGTYNLWWFCDGPTLIYFEDVDSGDDEYTLIWPGACTTEGKPKDMSGQNPQGANEPGDGN